MIYNSGVLGIDAGSVSVAAVKLDTNGNILDAGYVFHHGDIAGTIERLLLSLDSTPSIPTAATASTPPGLFSGFRVDNQIAVIEAATRLHTDLSAILLVGGEKFFLCRFDASGRYIGTIANTSCAAGTGSFLDQQAGRLKMSGIEELSATALNNIGTWPRIASRCAVFAKTDLIHAQQEGYGFEEISDGLCRGLAKNIVDTLFSKEPLTGNIIFCGGVSKNRAVAAHVEDLAGIVLTIPEHGHLYGAMGAALSFLNEHAKTSPPGQSKPQNIPPPKQQTRQYNYPPLQLKLSSYPDFSRNHSYLFNQKSNNPVEVDIFNQFIGNGSLTLGIDIGSTSTKAILMDSRNRVPAGFYTRTAGRPLAAVQSIFAAIEDLATQNATTFVISACATTGSGRKFIGVIVGADGVIDEITAHARAAVQLNPKVDTIIEIGGQDAKFTTLSNGRVTSSTMNNVCAAGTGSFIEEQAMRLGCAVEEYSKRAENVRAPMASDRCTVFMERDINHHLNEGFSIDEVLATALHSVRENYLMKVATEKNIGDVIYFQGATAKNKALVAAFEQRLQKPIIVSPLCHLTGAYGAALVVKEEKAATSSSRFRGINLHKASITISQETCGLCNNHCKLSVARTPHGKVAYGFLCGRDYDTKKYVANKNNIPDLLEKRDRLFEARPTTYRDRPVIGLPAALHMVNDLHLWHHFFDKLQIKTITSNPRLNHVTNGKKISLAEFCAPMAALHGHVDSLKESCDYIFLPNYLENRKKGARRQFCYYTQFAPGVIATADQGLEDKILKPVIRYLYTSFHTKVQLYRMLQSIMTDAPGFFEVAGAVDSALEYDNRCRRQLKQIYAKRRPSPKGIDVVLLGRPYSTLSPAMNCSIPSIFASLGVETFFQDMIDYQAEDLKNISPLLQEMHWEYGAQILEAAEIISRTRGSYPVYVTSFKCSPDSFTVDYFKAIMEKNNKPYLILELDEHDSNVGYETRIEAAVRSFCNHHQQHEATKLPDYRHINPDFTSELNGKNIILPNWDRLTNILLNAVLKKEGFQAYTMVETEDTIRRSLRYNSGQCIPMNAIAEGLAYTLEVRGLKPEETVLWLGEFNLACNIKLYPHHIKSILREMGLSKVGVYVGRLSFADISLRAASNAYFAYMFGGLLRRVACTIRPYELDLGTTDTMLEKATGMLYQAFSGQREREATLEMVISGFEQIKIKKEIRPKVAIFGDLYARDNRIMNQDLIRYIEENGGEVITTPYSEYAKMIAPTYFRKWFMEGKFLDYISNKATLTAMTTLEKKYAKIFDRILGNSLHHYDDEPAHILAEYSIARENSGESMDNILKIHYLTKYNDDISLFVQTNPSLCCASLITEAMKRKIEKKTSISVVSIVYDGTGGDKNSVILPYLRYGTPKKRSHSRKYMANSTF